MLSLTTQHADFLTLFINKINEGDIGLDDMFFKYYILIGLTGISILLTFSLRSLFEKNYEKAGLVLLWVSIIVILIFDINKLNLLWMAPAAFLIPYYFTRAVKNIYIRKIYLKLRYLMSFFF